MILRNVLAVLVLLAVLSACGDKGVSGRWYHERSEGEKILVSEITFSPDGYFVLSLQTRRVDSEVQSEPFEITGRWEIENGFVTAYTPSMAPIGIENRRDQETKWEMVTSATGSLTLVDAIGDNPRKWIRRR